MTPEHKIAYHHLGDMLRRVDRQGSRYQVVCDDGAIDHPPTAATGSTVAEAAADCASQLRAGGWVPSHARLEWARHTTSGNHTLDMLMDGAVLNVAVIVSIEQVLTQTYHHYTNIPARRAAVVPKRGTRFDSLEDAATHIAEWCAANLPNLHLPPFPSGDSQ
jgi:hypothetical protein